MSFKITINNKEVTFENKVKVLDIVGNNKDYICALVDNRVRDLNYEINKDAIVEPLTLSETEAVLIYDNSLRYIIAMAMKRIRPELNIRFSFNVSRSIFVQILNEGIRADRELVQELKAEIKKIVDADIPFIRKKVSVDEAKVIYKELGFEDKLEILPYRPEKTVHLYECDGYLNYFYGVMVPSTGYVKKWELKPYAPGIIVQYPRSESNGTIPAFKDAPIFGRTLKESHIWAKTTKLDSIAGINHYIENNENVELIQLCEARHYQMLSELGEEIHGRGDELRLICIAGPSSSGKTTFANRLRIELLSRGLRPIRLSIDDYYLPRSEAPLDENGKPDLESIYALDVPLLNRDILDLINGNEVVLPHFNFKTGKREVGRKFKIAHDQPLIIEGIHALNEELTSSIPKHQKYKIYISPQAQINIDNQNPISLTDLRLLRRIVRDHQFRNSSAQETLSMWPSVRKGEFKWIYDTQESADFVYNSLLSYELPVMRKHALPLLNEISVDSEFWPQAERLIRMLKYFLDLDEQWIPSNSLLREFIGGSCFQDV